MSPSPVTCPQPLKQISGMHEASDTLVQSVYALIKPHLFFKGLNTQQLQLLSASDLEMTF